MQVIGINTKHIAQIKIFYLVEVGLLIVGAGVIEFEFWFTNSKSILFVPKHLLEETLWKIVTNSVATEVISVDKVTGSKAIILYYKLKL